MPSRNANDDFDDELLSAYVDDELTLEERAAVEARLRSDPQAAQLVEELRSLSSAIKSLPRETVGRDLRASVQAEAEQAKAEASASEVFDVAPPFGRWAGVRRGLAWSAVAIAATLLLMVVVPEETARDAGTVAKVSSERELAHKNRGDAAEEPPERQPTMRALEVGPKDTAGPAPAGGLSETAPAGSATPAAGAADRSMKEDAPLGKKLEEETELQRAAEPPMPETDRMDVLSEELALGTEAAVEPSTALADADARRARSFGAMRQALPTKVELALKTPAGVEQFERLLIQHKIELVPEPREAADFAYTPGLEGAVAGVDVDANAEAEKREEPSTESTAGLDAQADSAEAAMVVEASPDQIKDLLVACQSNEAFADVKDDSKLLEAGQAAALGGELPESGVEERRGFAGGFGGAAQRARSSSTPAPDEPQAAASTPLAAGGEQATGRAWRVPPVRLGDAEAERLAFGGRAKEKLAQRGARDEAGAAGAALSSPPAEKPSAGEDKARRSRALAKAPAGSPQAEQVQVLFVLRTPPPEMAAPSKAAQ